MQAIVQKGRNLVLGLAFLAALLTGCTSIFPTADSPDCAVNINILVNAQRRAATQGGVLQKSMVITKVTVTISASDMSTITADLTGSGNTFTGSVSVPKGNGRLFSVQAKDAAGILQYQGSATQDLTTDNASVSIEVEPLKPTAAVLSISGFSSSSITLNWTKCNDADFHSYLIQRSLTTSFDLNNYEQDVEEITNKNSTSYTDTGLSPGTKYYYKIWTIDTEKWATGSNIVNTTTSTLFIFKVRNPLFTDIKITVTDKGTYTIAPDDSLLISYSSNPGTISFSAYTHGSTTSGTQLGERLEWDKSVDVSSKNSYTTSLICSSTYFFLYMRNSGSHMFDKVIVNYDLASEAVLNIEVPADGTRYRIGYFRAYTNTVIKAYWEDGTSWIWEQGRQFTLPFTDNQYIELLMYSTTCLGHTPFEQQLCADVE